MECKESHTAGASFFSSELAGSSLSFFSSSLGSVVVVSAIVVDVGIYASNTVVSEVKDRRF